MHWPLTSSVVVYQNPWIRVVEDQVLRPDGSPGPYGVVELAHEAVFVVALTEAREVLLIHVDRHTTGWSWEVPAGGSDGEDLLAAAQRELAEETGYTATEWRQIGQSDGLNGICRAPETVFLATGLSGGAAGSVDQVAEGIGQVRAVPLPEVLRMVVS